MIFVTVGSQLRFDRLVCAVDDWAARNKRADVFAQIGETRVRPRAMEWTPKLDRARFLETMARASAVVSHAGTGTIITALELGTPLIVLPRRASLGETRNDHQIATARCFQAAGLLRAAHDEHELVSALDAIDRLTRPPEITAAASPELIDAVRTFLAAG